MVSQLGHSSIAARFAAANANHASSTELRRSESITAMPHRLDGSVLAELLPEPPDADLDDVRARIEVVAPDVREQPFPAHDLAFVEHQVVEEPELAVRELRDEVSEAGLPAREVERERPRPDNASVLPVRATPELGPDARHELVERERLREVVAGPEPEAA